jgi:hypothetical protein
VSFLRTTHPIHSHLLTFPFHPISSHPTPIITGTLLLSLNLSLNFLFLFLNNLYSPCSSSLYSAIQQLRTPAAETTISTSNPISGKIRHCETHSCACSCHNHNHPINCGPLTCLAPQQHLPLTRIAVQSRRPILPVPLYSCPLSLCPTVHRLIQLLPLL